MIVTIARVLLEAYEWMVPPPEPMCQHGFGVMVCTSCRKSFGQLCKLRQSIPDTNIDVAGQWAA